MGDCNGIIGTSPDPPRIFNLGIKFDTASVERLWEICRRNAAGGGMKRLHPIHFMYKSIPLPYFSYFQDNTPLGTLQNPHLKVSTGLFYLYEI